MHFVTEFYVCGWVSGTSCLLSFTTFDQVVPRLVLSITKSPINPPPHVWRVLKRCTKAPMSPMSRGPMDAVPVPHGSRVDVWIPHLQQVHSGKAPTPWWTLRKRGGNGNGTGKLRCVYPSLWATVFVLLACPVPAEGSSCASTLVREVVTPPFLHFPQFFTCAPIVPRSGHVRSGIASQHHPSACYQVQRQDVWPKHTQPKPPPPSPALNP